MCCDVDHRIELLNLENNCVFTHELIIIKGLIRKPCSQKQIEIKTVSGCSFGVVVNGEFKILHRLQTETEEFHISYCNASIKFKCHYRPSVNPYKIQALYIICKGHNGSFNASHRQCGTAAEACAIIDLNIKLLQCLYAEKLNESGFGRKTFSLQSNCQIFESSMAVEEAWECTQEELWNKFAFEVINSEFGNDSKVKFVAFIGCTKYEAITDGNFSYENIRRHLKGNAALGGGGLALFGSAYFYAWPSKFEDIRDYFDNSEQVDLERYADDSNYRRTYAGVYATTLGAVCHEMGHIFDLGHTKDGVMGNGFDYLNRVFTFHEFTESLPDRIFGEAEQTRRFTKIKRGQNSFLEKYHEQKAGGDSFYFTRSCAVILAHHRWLANGATDETKSQISLDREKLAIVASDPIKIIEIRCSGTSLVEEYFEFNDDNRVCRFKLPKKVDYKKHHVFVMCANGMSKRIEFGTTDD